MCIRDSPIVVGEISKLIHRGGRGVTAAGGGVAVVAGGGTVAAAPASLGGRCVAAFSIPAGIAEIDVVGHHFRGVPAVAVPVGVVAGLELALQMCIRDRAMASGS